MYVVCLECGKEFAYDWEQMKVFWHPKHSAETAADQESQIAATAA